MNLHKNSLKLGHNEDAIIERTKIENIIGNLETDSITNKISTDFALLTNEAFRAAWYPGTLYLEDILNMNPFLSKIVTVEMTFSRNLSSYEYFTDWK